jgi:hypothetical protein
MKQYREELQSIDSLLDIVWVENIRYNAEHRSFEGAYAVACHFRADDPRRELFRSGEMDNDYDIICWLTKDIHNAELPVDPAEIWPKVLETLRSADNTRESWKVRMANAAAKNLELKQKRKKDFLEGVVHDDASYNRTRNLGNVIVNVPKEIK